MQPLLENILVFGANGQLGTSICQVLANVYNIIPVTRDKLNIAVKEEIHLLLTNLLRQYNLKAIINCIAFTNVNANESNISQAFQVNTLFVAELANFCKCHDIILVHFSSDYVFDGKLLNYQYKETDFANPLNIYGLSKYSADAIIIQQLKKYFIFRVSSVFGSSKNNNSNNFITTILKLAATKDKISVIADQISCPTHSDDIATAVKQMLTFYSDHFGLYNCVSSSSCSWFEFAQLILKQKGYDQNKIEPISYSDYKFIANRPQYSVLNINKLSQFFLMPTYQDAFLNYWGKNSII